MFWPMAIAKGTNIINSSARGIAAECRIAHTNFRNEIIKDFISHIIVQTANSQLHSVRRLGDTVRDLGVPVRSLSAKSPSTLVPPNK